MLSFQEQQSLFFLSIYQNDLKLVIPLAYYNAFEGQLIDPFYEEPIGKVDGSVAIVYSPRSPYRGAFGAGYWRKILSLLLSFTSLFYPEMRSILAEAVTSA